MTATDESARPEGSLPPSPPVAASEVRETTRVARPRSFLFLQGPQSRFFRKLGNRLLRQGHQVLKVDFCGGDALLWGWKHSVWYRGDLYRWPAWLDRVFRERQVTDLVLMGDWRPFHHEAIQLARLRGLHVSVLEEGYLRPDFITFERDGVNGLSRLPRDPDAIRAMATELGRHVPARELRPSLRKRVYDAIRHHAGNFFGFPLFRHYRTHRPHSMPVELPYILGRYLCRRGRLRRDAPRAEAFLADPAPFFFFPLQLESDAQIQRYSNYGTIHGALATAMASFARAAPPGTRLLVRNHPLDNGMTNLKRFADRFADVAGLGERFLFVDEGNTNRMIKKSRGVVVVNSTTGLTALTEGRPVFCLGRAIFAMPGLATFGGEQALDRFWTAPPAPDPELLDAFIRVLQAYALVPGNFYTKDGMALAVTGCVKRLLSEQPPVVRRYERMLAESEAPPSGTG